MKAMVYTEYGPPEVLQLKEVEKPVPADDDVLVKVQAVSLNSSDVEFLTAKPSYVRFWGLLRPKHQILGSDIAGTVEAVGRNVKKFKPGDAVFGDIFQHWGGLAEYCCAPADTLFMKPESMTFEEAAAIPQAALIALQGLQYRDRVKPGDSVLINGAGGGAGSFAIQLAKLFGAEVTAVDNGLKLDLMKSLGADFVIDYTNEDFTKKDQQYQRIVDFVASHPIFDYRRALAPGGIYVMVGGNIPHIISTLTVGSVISLLGNRKMKIMAVKPTTEMAFIIEQIESGKIRPVIDKKYTLSEAAEAFRYLAEGRARGKVVITLENFDNN
jgi:NADPH:quinone reductase-like Zn-dependent oxidoreductase